MHHVLILEAKLDTVIIIVKLIIALLLPAEVQITVIVKVIILSHSHSHWFVVCYLNLMQFGLASSPGSAQFFIMAFNIKSWYVTNSAPRLRMNGHHCTREQL